MHPKPDEIIEEFVTTQEKLESVLHEDAQSKEEKFCTQENAELCLEQVLKMMELLFKQAKLKAETEKLCDDEGRSFDYNMPLWLGGQSGSASSE